MHANLFLNLILSFMSKTNEGIAFLKTILFPGSSGGTGRPDYLDDPDLYDVEQPPEGWVDPYDQMYDGPEVGLVGCITDSQCESYYI
jgi:hypothetical protein